MNNHKQLFVIALFAIGAFGFSMYTFFHQPRIAYIRSHDLIYKYAGMKEASENFEKKKSEWEGNVDTLSIQLQRSIDKYNKDSRSMSRGQRSEMENYLTAKQKELSEYASAATDKVQDENEKMLEGIFNQINSYVEGYGKENNYDIILGTTLSGNIMYGDKYLDITDQVLKELNENYNGKPAK